MSYKLTLALTASILVSLTGFSSAFAQEAEEEEEYGGYKPISNSDIMNMSHVTPQHKLFEAEQAIAHKEYKRAEKLLRQTLDADDEEIDAHKFLAICLEEKLKKQTVEERDPQMFKECVDEWLIVLRGLKGIEKGLNIKGVAPGFGEIGRYDDEQHQGMARQHLQKLCGSVPKRWETNKMYISRVTKPAETDVNGEVVKIGAKKAPRTE